MEEVEEGKEEGRRDPPTLEHVTAGVEEAKEGELEWEGREGRGGEENLNDMI